jgi:hypothetical protein
VRRAVKVTGATSQRARSRAAKCRLAAIVGQEEAKAGYQIETDKKSAARDRRPEARADRIVRLYEQSPAADQALNFLMQSARVATASRGTAL